MMAGLAPSACRPVVWAAKMGSVISTLSSATALKAGQVTTVMRSLVPRTVLVMVFVVRMVNARASKDT